MFFSVFVEVKDIFILFFMLLFCVFVDVNDVFMVFLWSFLSV